MPRISASETALGPLLAGPLRLQPPDRLTGPAREVFVETVASAEPGHFQPVDVHLIALYAGVVAIERQAAEKLAAGNLQPQEMRAWADVQRSMAQSVTGFARVLALGPKARRPSRPRARSQPSSYEMMKRSPWD